MGVKYSIVVLPSLFRKNKLTDFLSVATVDTELIAVDSDYNKETKEFFREYINNYRRIVYLPPRLQNEKLKLRYASLWNTAFLYAEGDWIICIKPGVELSQELIMQLCLSIDDLIDQSGGEDFALISGKSTQFLNDDENLQYLKLMDCAYLPFDVAVFPRKYLDTVNGYDELYDYMGAKAEDADKDFFCRLSKAGCTVYFDKELSDYYETYPTFRFQFVEPLVNLFYFQRFQIMNGKVKAFNGFDYKEDNIKCLAFREEFELVGEEFEVIKVEDNEYTVKCFGKEIALNTYSSDDFVSSWISNVGYYEIGLLRELVKYTKNKVVIDVGAYIGTHSVYISKFGDPEKVYAFEPDSRSFGLLKKNIEANDLDDIVIPINKGVWDSDTVVSFRTADESNRGVSKVDYTGNTTIQVVSLDKFCSDGRCDCIKIDIEGNELKVLEGARKIITDSRPVLAIEVHGTKFEFPDWMLKLGYKVKKIRSGNMNHVVLVHGVHNSDYKPLEKVVEFPI